MSNKKDTKKTLKNLQAKRANFRAGGYGYGGDRTGPRGNSLPTGRGYGGTQGTSAQTVAKANADAAALAKTNADARAKALADAAAKDAAKIAADAKASAAAAAKAKVLADAKKATASTAAGYAETKKKLDLPDPTYKVVPKATSTGDVTAPQSDQAVAQNAVADKVIRKAEVEPMSEAEYYISLGMNSSLANASGGRNANARVEWLRNNSQQPYNAANAVDYSALVAADINLADIDFNTLDFTTLYDGPVTATSSEAPIGIKMEGPQANLRQMEATGIDQESGITKDIQKLGAATDARSSTVASGYLKAAQGNVSQAELTRAIPKVEQYANKFVEQFPEMTESQKSQAKAWAQQSRQGGKAPMPSFLMNMDFLKGIEAANSMTYDQSGEAEGYEAATVSGKMGDTIAADGTVSEKAVAGQAKTPDEVDTAQRDDDAEKAALGTAAQRPDEKDYATGVTTDETFRVEDVEGPAVTTSEGVTISDAKIAELTKLAVERGVDPAKAIQDFKDAAATRTAQTGTAAEGTYKPRLGEAPEETAARARTYGADYTPQGGNTEIDATPAYEKAATRVVQVGEAAQRIATELGDAPSVDLEGREAITGTAPQGNASQIGGIPTMAAASRQGVTGQDRKVAAADMMAVVADVPEEITAAISEDPATVQAQIDEGADPQVTAAVAALPEEALVSTQMEGLLAGMEDGETPLWARPAVAAIEAQMAQRGLSASSVGRDALFNAIIQSALPIAQSNAQALQTRAQQNLSNEQQANLASAQNTMQVRMQNLSNRQTAASQTAQMAQEIKVQQGSFTQQATLATATQEQQSSMATFDAAQAKAQQESAQRQQAAISQLGTNAQMDLANLQALNAAGSDNMSADQQAKLQSYNAQINKIMRTADLKQDMEKANLAPALQVEMQRVSEMNAAAKDTMSVEQTERLTNLQTLVEFRKTDASFAQQMDMANMTNEQQMELAMLQDRAATDTANFTADNQFRFQELNNIVERSARQADLNQRMEEVNLDSKLKVELSELAEKNTTSRANMTAEQQTRLANLNVLVDFRKTNAAMAQQMDIANLGNEQQMELAMLQEKSAVDTANFTEANRARTQELNTFVQVMSQNEQFKQNADMAKLSMQEKINLANLSSQSQADMASMSAENIAELQVYEKKMAAGQVNAKLAQEMGLANLSNEQSAAMFNAQINANFDMSQMSNEQQMEMANSKFMQTMTATQFSAEQQSAMQNATLLAQTDLANADARTRVSVENAKNFLTMDMANLSNEQQAIVLDQQMAQQALLSDQSSQNVAKQFRATSQNQLDQFLISQSNNMRQFNTTARNAMESFNTAEFNRAAAITAGNQLQADQITATLEADISKFNASIDNQRDQWNAANEQAVEQSNIQWRRQANTADTAATNAANQVNVQNAYNISALDQTQMWQTLRDEAAYIRQSYENNEQREAQLIATAIGNESATSSKDTGTTTASLIKILGNYGYKSAATPITYTGGGF